MTDMPFDQQVITIALCALGTMLTRFLPFLLFSGKKATLALQQWKGQMLLSIAGGTVLYMGPDGIWVKRGAVAHATAPFFHIRSFNSSSTFFCSSTASFPSSTCLALFWGAGPP